MNFKKVIDRTKNKERKWDSEFLRKEYKIDTSKKYYNLSIADLDFKSPKPIISSIVERAKKGTYSYTYAEADSFTAIQSWYKTLHNIDINLKDIRLVHGTVNAMFQTIKCFTKPKDSVLIQTPIYQPFERAIIKTGRKLIQNELKVNDGKFEIDFQDFEEKIKQYSVKLFMFCNPHNPGGRVWTSREIMRIIEICNKYDVLIFSDEVHGDLLLTKKHNSLLRFKESSRVIVCNSPNKTFNLGGLKGSFMICENEDILNNISDQYENDSITSPNVFFQPALQAAYTSPKCLVWLINLKNTIIKNKELVIEMLSRFHSIEVMVMECSYLIWIKINSKLNSKLDWKNLETDFLDSNLIFSYGDEFAGGNNEWLRINIGLSKKQLAKILNKTIKILEMRGVK